MDVYTELFISERTEPYSGVPKWSVSNIFCEKCGGFTKWWHTGLVDYGGEFEEDYVEYMCADCLSTGWCKI